MLAPCNRSRGRILNGALTHTDGIDPRDIAISRAILRSQGSFEVCPSLRRHQKVVPIPIRAAPLKTKREQIL
jgi:hypothetical protein